MSLRYTHSASKFNCSIVFASRSIHHSRKSLAPLEELHLLQRGTKFSIDWEPPFDRGMMWSPVEVVGTLSPQLMHFPNELNLLTVFRERECKLLAAESNPFFKKDRPYLFPNSSVVRYQCCHAHNLVRGSLLSMVVPLPGSRDVFGTLLNATLGNDNLSF